MTSDAGVNPPSDAAPSAPSPALLRIEGDADRALVDRLLEAMEAHLAGAAAATDQDRFLFTLAVSEVVTNIVEHGGGDATMQADIETLPGELQARIRDTAQPALIDWDTVHLPDDDAESGRGLVLALSVLDELRHTRSVDGNTWLLRRRIPGAAPRVS